MLNLRELKTWDIEYILKCIMAIYLLFLCIFHDLLSASISATLGPLIYVENDHLLHSEAKRLQKQALGKYIKREE